MRAKTLRFWHVAIAVAMMVLPAAGCSSDSSLSGQIVSTIELALRIANVWV